MSTHPLDPIFHPRTVALFGVPSKAEAWGAQFHRALIDSGYDKSRMFLINPKADEIDGLPCYHSLMDVPAEVDHVISLVPARVVPELVDQCVAKGIRSLHLFTAGLAETGDPAMAKVERDAIAKLRAAGIRTIGPNCLGLYVPASGMTFSGEFPMEAGNVMLISQSGANAGEIVRSLTPRGVRFSKAVSFGNGADLKAHDFFDYAATDPDTDVVVSYLEGVSHGRELFDSLKRCAAVKPTIILKGGLSGAGARAASSHTGSLAGSRAVFEAACRQSGAIRVDSMDELQDLTVAIATSARKVTGRRVLLVGGPGGFAVISSDIIADQELELPETPALAKQQLREFIPVAGTSVNNPIDANPRDREQMQKMMHILCDSGAYDVVFSTSLGSDPGGPGRGRGRRGPSDTEPEEKQSREEIAAAELERAREGAKLIAKLQDEIGLPILYVQRGGGQSDGSNRQATAAFENGIATFPSVLRAAHTVRQLMEWRARREGLPTIF
ncbi:MAG TPA: CoA-binding protein [Tepidiformaceae bacterium]|jgi:acyl-CoA synthetase (NDP forming)